MFCTLKTKSSKALCVMYVLRAAPLNMASQLQHTLSTFDLRHQESHFYRDLLLSQSQVPKYLAVSGPQSRLNNL